MAAVYGAAAPWLPLAFTSDAEVAVAVWALLPLVICMLPLNALVYVLDGILVGASDFKFLAGTVFLPGRQEPRLTPLHRRILETHPALQGPPLLPPVMRQPSSWR